MNWAVELSAAAEKDLQRLPRDRQARIERAINETAVRQLNEQRHRHDKIEV
jgi:mRNA-degrading endonuclease RelE of RelBE toxin-antitoxin system